MGAKEASDSRSESTIMVAPSFTACAASTQISSIRRLMPPAPSEASQVTGIQWEKNLWSPDRTIDSNSASERTGLASSIRWA